MSCEISVIYPGLEHDEITLEIPETRRAFGIVSFGSDPTVCFGSAPGMGGFVLDRWEAEEYGILPRHCALLWAGGKFRLEFDRHAGVYLNGSNTCARSFCNPFEDSNEFTMRLGLPVSDASGTDLGIAPVFKVRRKDRGYAKTGWLTALALRFKWFRRVAMMPFLVRLPAVVMALFAMGLVFLAWNLNQDHRITEALIRGDVPQQIGAEYAPSVASIGVMCEEDGVDRYTSLGTAWLFQHQAGSGAQSHWLVTNNHVVAQMRDKSCANSDWVAKFPPPAGQQGETTTLTQLSNPVTHPLHDAFEAFRSTHQSPIEGQPAVANLYDIAAFELGPDQREQLTSQRRFLSLEAPSSKVESSFDINRLFDRDLEPGRPVLILSYPTENQPFLTSGVSTAPFQFRTALESKTNAMSRQIPGRPEFRTPALYSFSAKSAGGMSGSPVIALDSKQRPFVSGIVFSASFVAGPALVTGGPPTRLASGDGTYALDATSLATLPNWRQESLRPDAEQLTRIQKVWARWADATSPLDEAWQQFSDLNEAGDNALKVCAASRTVRLSRRVNEKKDIAPRGVAPEPVALRLGDLAQNTLITAEARTKTGAGQLLQLAIQTDRNGRKVTSHRSGLDQATFLKIGDDPLDVELAVASALNDTISLTLYEAVAAGAACPEREDWNGR